MLKSKLYIILFLIISLSIQIKAQSLDDFRELIPLPTKDTLVLDRSIGDWWFGPTGGLNANYFFNKLQMPLTYSVLDTLVPFPDSLIDFPSGKGIGYYVGLYGEWNPKGKNWGMSVSLFLQDFKNGIAETAPSADTTKEIYQAITKFNYISVSPSVRYNFSVKGLYAIGGFDFDYCVTSRLVNTLKFKNSGDIDQEKKNLTTLTKFRYGLHIGLGYEFLIADISHKYRLLYNPYITLNTGSSIMSDFGSSRNIVFARIGLILKLGPDNIRKDTLAYNPNYKPNEVVATSRRENGPFFPGMIEPLIAFEAQPVERSHVSEEVAEKSTIDITEKVSTRNDAPKKITIRTGQLRTFYFPSSTTTTLSNDIKEYLDYVAEFLIANPTSTARITGHSDDQGSISQNQKRSEDRAKQVVQYLVGKGISLGRLIPRGDGSRVPIALNTTEEGRKKNRRVEILIVQ